ncbi:MAG: type VI secretion protein IcmF/TssM N-terminal domain-containing protein [Succinivibrio sp.]
MENNTQMAENLGSSLLDSTTGIILLALIIIISLVIVYFLFKRIKFKHDISKERRSLKEDLMIWSSLANLVAGGKKRKKGKEDLTADVKIVRMIFDSALSLIRAKCYKKLKTPWVVILGEPLSGKSSILANSSLGCDLSRRELDANDEECLHFFVNRNTVFLDVKGKTFFDTWLGGSSAQWEVICEQIKKYHHSKPLSGVVLTIPADALIADDRELTVKKANLIASELHKLSSVLCMNLPCKVVITKSDCILGFREFFSNLSQSQREQVVGIDLTTEDGFFSEEDFLEKWTDFVSRLKNGAVALMSSKEVTDRSFNGGNRLDKSAYIYSFPEHIDAIGQSLELYLKTIFEKTSSFRPNLIDGVYFVSSVDQGISLSPGFASLQGKSVDEALIVDSDKSSKKSYFIKQLFLNLIHGMDSNAVFTKRERLIRNIPIVTLYTVLCALSINYISGALMGRTLIYDRLHSDLVYFKSLKSMFENNYIVNSPLIDVDESGHGYNRFNDFMEGNLRSSRINFFTEAKARLLNTKSLPIIYFPSSYLMGDFNNICEDERNTIYNQILINMVYSPATSSFALDLLRREDLFTEKKADALLSFMYLSVARSADDVKGIEILEDSVEKILAYQYPDISPKLLAQITDMKSGDDDYAKAAATQILLDPNYAPAVNHGIKMLMGQFSRVEAYPESRYQLIKKNLQDGYSLSRTYIKLMNYDYAYSDEKSDDEYIKEYRVLQQAVHNAVVTAENLDSTGGMFLQDYSSPVSALSAKEGESESITLQRQLLVNIAHKNYTDIVLSDFESFDNYVSISDSTGTDMVESVVLPTDVYTAKNTTIAALERDKQNIYDLMETVNLTRVFDKVAGDPTGKKLNYQLANELMSIADTTDIRGKLEKTSDFVERFNTLNTIFKNRNIALDNFQKRVAQMPNLAKLASSISDYLVFAEFTSKMILTKQLLSLYPDTQSRTSNLAKLGDLISQSDDREYEKILSPDVARESLGYFEIDDQFSPSAVRDYINPVAVLENFRNVKIEDGKEKTPLSQANAAFANYLSKNARAVSVTQTVGDYADRFVNYWATFADTLKPYESDYQSFHEFALNSKSYLINTQLLDIYNFSYDLLSSVNDDSVFSKTKNTRKYALKVIDDRRKTLSLNFTQACTNVLNAWAMLPEDALKANRYVSALDKKSVRNDYTLVRNLSDAKGNIPWWTSFVNLGTTLLKSEASYQTAAGLEAFQNRLYYFPVLKDASTDTMTLDIDDMPVLNRELKSYGIVKEKEKNEPGTEKIEMAADESVDNLQDPLLNNVMAGRQDVRTWAGSVSRILSDLGDRKNRTVAKLSIPDIGAQEELIKQSGIGLPNASFFFRYVSISSDDKKSERFSTVVENVQKSDPRVIYENDVNGANFVISLYRYSDAKLPDVTYKVAGNYAAIRMYLDEKAVYSEKEHCSYVPVVVKNRMGDKSVLFIKVEFNKELLRPDEWPDSENWPSITAF